MESSNEEKIELQDQFILRLPQAQAKKISHAIKHCKTKKFKKYLSINLHNNNKKEIQTGTVKVKRQLLNAKLVNLPCIIEAYKTVDRAHLFKTADISQMLICQVEPLPIEEENSSENKNKKLVHMHGVAPPLKNVKKQRFRRILKNKDDLEGIADIEKEVLWLLRSDNEAISTRFEIYYEEPQLKTVSERTLFGEILSDFDSCDESSVDSEKISTVN